MKKFIMYLLAILVLPTSLYALKPSPKGSYKFDIKTETLQKNELKYIKVGLTTMLNNCSWSKVVNMKEDYAIWIRNYQIVKKSDSTFRTYIDIELRKPSFLKKGVELKNDFVQFEYNVYKDYLELFNSSAINEMLTSIDKSIKTKAIAADAINVTEHIPLVRKTGLSEILIKDLGLKADNHQKTEALMLSIILWGTVKKWMLEIEAGK